VENGPQTPRRQNFLTSFVCINDLFNSPESAKLSPSRIRKLTGHVVKGGTQAVYKILITDSLGKWPDFRPKRHIKVNIKPDIGERRRGVSRLN
jgi:hypothetical protein